MLKLPWLLTTLLLAGGDYADRPPHPLIASVPLLSKEENAKIEAVVDRFIQLEIGKLPKAQEKQAKDAIYRLGPEAIFALVDGFNRAAVLESSCGTVTIGRKIEGIVRASDDPGLIAFVRENVGAGIDTNGRRPLPLLNAIRNVQTTCVLRKGALARMGITTAKRAAPAPAVAVGSMSLAELAKAVTRQQGEPLKKVLIEVERRQSAQVPAILGKAAAGKDPAGRKLAKVLLVQHAEKQSPTQLKVLLKHDDPEVRAAAARTVGAKGLRYGEELIALLQDDQPVVRQAAHAALVALAAGRDFGPMPGASFGDRVTAAQQWRNWWREQAPAP